MQDNAAILLHIIVDNQIWRVWCNVCCSYTHNLMQRLSMNASMQDVGALGTALHIAVEHNNTAIIRALITGDAHFDFHCENLGIPLDYVMLLERTQSIKALLQLGATTTSELSSHQRRKILNVRGGREPEPDRDVREEGSGLAEPWSRKFRIDDEIRY